MSPKNARRIAKIIAIIVALALLASSFSLIVFADSTEEHINWEEEFIYLIKLINDIKANYKDDITYRELIDGTYEGIFNKLKDPYSVYYKSDTESDAFIESVSGEFSGIGVRLVESNGRCMVESPVADSPAEKAGLQAGDFIVKVDDTNIAGMQLDSIVNLIKGETGTRVKITVEREGKLHTVSLVREVIRISSVSYRLLDDNIGYIRIAQMDSDTHLEFKNAKLRLIAQGAKSFIIDLRNNAGGYTQVAIDIADQLMPKGPITHFEQKGEIKETVYATGHGDLGIPVVLLVNKGTASASEILAAALKESGVATLVGTRTYGKGVAQKIVNMDMGSSYKLSMYYFLTPNKNKIDKLGITPDYIVENYKGIDRETLLTEYSSFAKMSEERKPKLGDLGLNVYGAQQRLSLLGYEVQISGTMDQKTTEAVKAFQKSQGLYEYGVLDYATMNALDQAAYEYSIGADIERDLQLEKAVELLT